MINELVVTSAPRGLQAGRSGFTTVYRTRGIHPDLASRLEAASGYRHVFPQGDPRNPTIFSYMSKPTAVGEVWVLSRIGDAGTDYTGRSNKLAHHIALQQEDIRSLSGSNPAAALLALAANRTLLSRWDGEPRESPTPPQIPAPSTNTGACQSWATVAGDAGWAGYLVERAVEKDSTWIVVPPGVDLLSLFSEALTLVAPEQRWQIPFTTYSLRGDEGRWLGTVAGSPEAAVAIAQNRIPVIDLTQRSHAPAGGAYAAAARGLAPPPWQRSARAVQPLSREQKSVQRGNAQPVPSTIGMSGAPPKPAVPPVLARAPSLGGPQPPELTEWEEVPLAKRPLGRIASAIGGSALLIAVAVAVATMILKEKFDWPQWDDKEDVAQSEEAGATKRKDGTALNSAEKIEKAHAQQEATPEKERTPPPAAPHPHDIAKASVMNDAVSIAENTKKQVKPSSSDEQRKVTVSDALFKQLEKKNFFPNKGLNEVRSGEDSILLISWLEDADPATLKDVRLGFPEIRWPSGHGFKLEDTIQSGNTREWKCVQSATGRAVGAFVLTPNQLSFRYESTNSAVDKENLSLVPMVISAANGKTKQFQLLKPQKKSVLQLRGNEAQKATSGSGTGPENDFLNAMFKENVITLKWGKTCVVSAHSTSPIQISENNEDLAFENRLSLCLPIGWNEPKQATLLWRPAAYSRPNDDMPSLLSRELKVELCITRKNGEFFVAGMSAFSWETALDKAAILSRQTATQLRAHLRGSGTYFERVPHWFLDNDDGSLFARLNSTVRDHELNHPKKKREKLDAVMELKKVSSMNDLLAEMKKQIVASNLVKDRIQLQAEKDLRGHPFHKIRPAPPSESPDEKKARENEVAGHKKTYDRELAAKKNEFEKSDEFLLKLAEEEEEKAARGYPEAVQADDAERRDPKPIISGELVSLMVYRELLRFSEEQSRGFVGSRMLQNDGNDEPLKILEDVAGAASVDVIGNLGLQWNTEGDADPSKGLTPVRLVRFCLSPTSSDGEGQTTSVVDFNEAEPAGHATPEEGRE